MISHHTHIRVGTMIAAALSGCWREQPAPPDFSEAELSMVTASLNETGAAALLWWRIRNSALCSTAIGQRLEESYKLLRLAARVHEQEIEFVYSLLRAEGIEPVLVKGWAIARRYPDSALRPYGDIDLCVRPDQLSRADAALKCLERIDGHYVDLHDGFAKLEAGRRWHGRPARGLDRVQDTSAMRAWNDLFERTQLVNLGDENIRVLSEEDHLRVLCLHLLRSGAWRPLWLCDVALAVEARAADFDWDRCLGADRLQANWVASTIGLAHRLLGIDVKGTPVAESCGRLPRWLVPAVLRQWSRGRNPDAAGMALPVLRENVSTPGRFFNEIDARWDNPVRATAALRGSFNRWPRWPYQLAELLFRSPEVPRQLAMMLRLTSSA
jgi:hypothetical protein